MIRATKKFTITAGGTPQPLVGTKTTAAVGPSQRMTGLVGAQDIFAIPVTDASFFIGKDWIIIGVPGAEERLQIMTIAGNTLSVKLPQGGLKNAYANGSYVRLSVLINSTYVQPSDGNAGFLFIGTSNVMVTATGVLVVVKLAQVAAGSQPVDFHDGRSGLQNADDIGMWWIDGTTGDGYLPSMGIV